MTIGGQHAPMHPAQTVEATDATGAGDALAAGYLVGGIELAMATAADCVQSQARSRLTTDRVPSSHRHAWRPGQAEARLFSTEVKNGRPSVPGPQSDSTACSGCGIRPTTLPASLVMPAMSRREPLGLTSR